MNDVNYTNPTSRKQGSANPVWAYAGLVLQKKNRDSHLGEVLLLVEDVHEAEDEDGGHVNGQGDEEHEEVAIVPASDAVVDPRTVVVKNLKIEIRSFP